MADGSRHNAYFVAESSYGVTPASPALTPIRLTGISLGLERDSLRSDEIRSNRQTTDMPLGANKVQGSIDFELSYGSHDDFLQAALMSTAWASPADTGATTLDATATGYTRAAGSFITDGFKVGQTVVASGFSGAGLNGKSRISAVTALELTTTPYTGSHGVEAGAGAEQVLAAQQIMAGVSRQSFTIVRHFEDLDSGSPYIIYRGVEVTSMNLKNAANDKVTGSFSLIGSSQELAADLSGLGTPTFNAVSGSRVMNSFSGDILEGGSAIADVTEVDMTLDNGIEPRFVIGSTDTILPSAGYSELSGSTVSFFNSTTLVEKFINETNSSMNINLPDADGNSINLIMPKIKYMSGGKPDVSDVRSISISSDFSGLEDVANSLNNLIIERVPA